jgi:predicted alpha/beta superfamily hydrolase
MKSSTFHYSCKSGFFLVLLISFFVACTSSDQNSTQQTEPLKGFPLGMTGTIIQHDSIPTQFVETRPVTVWLPPSYDDNRNQDYPVLYFMDGQNVFNPKTSYTGVDWALDEWADSLITAGQMEEVIIVGVWNSPKRFLEYMPEKSVDYFSKDEMEWIKKNSEISVERPISDDFLSYLTEDILPFINQEYRTKTGRENTLIGGSSMGGLISLYALTEYPDVFGTALCVSTHWPAAQGVSLRYFEDNLPEPGSHKVYFDYGTETLDAEYEPYQVQMDSVMKARGYSENEDWITLKFEGHKHSESDWRQRGDSFLLFGLGK